MKYLLSAALATAGMLVMAIGGLVDVRGIVIVGTVLGVVGAVVSLVVGILGVARDRRPGARALATAFAVSGVVAGTGYSSWFFIDDSSINIAGLGAMVLGAVALWGFAVPLSRRMR